MNSSPNPNNPRFIRVHSENGRTTYGWMWQDQYGWNAESYPDGISWSHIDSKELAIKQLEAHYHQRRST
jgi:hypothetical protein